MRIAVFAGPTGGHFYPALAFVESFKKRHPEAQVLFVTGKRGAPLVQRAESQVEARFKLLPDFPLPRLEGLKFLIRFPVFLVKLVQAFWDLSWVLGEFGPDLCVGFGSYIAFPGLVLARIRKIPTLIHEQNVKMGRANEWLSRWADRVAFSFEGQGPVVTGYPIRSSLIKQSGETRYRDRAFIPDSRFRILLVGGSQGSSSINRLWIEIIPSLSGEEKSKIAVFHITGKRDFERFKQMYPSLGIEAEVFEFYDKMEELYSKSDMAITRSGAGTLFELALFGVPAVVLPYPHADGHQEANARYFEKEGALLLLPEHEASPSKLKEALFELIKSPSLRSRLSQNLTRLAERNASEKLVDLADELLRRETCLT